MSRGLTRATALAVLAAPLLALLLPSPAADAHPLGLPAFAQVVATAPTEVEVRWNAAPDDVAALARSLGVADASLLTREQDSALASSDELADLVARDVAVEQAERSCRATFAAPASVVTAGITVRFACPEPVAGVQVRIALLHDVDRRYRTLAAAAGPEGVERAMFTAEEPEHVLALDPAAAGLLPAPAPQAAPEPGGAADDVQGAFGGALALERRFVAAVDTPAGLPAAAVALLAAVAIGALHALAPGHGKAIAAAYLVGERARAREAVVLGTTVALMHCGSVLVLGLALYSASRRPDAARLTSALTLVGGLVVAALGAWLLVRRFRERRRAAHSYGHDHSHAIPDRPLSRQGIVALGAAGGLLPSPSALLVLLTALALGRLAYGLALVVAFSVGLATTLTLVGVAVLRGRDVAHSRAGARLHRLVHAAPLAGAVAVVLAGTAVAARAGAALA